MRRPSQAFAATTLATTTLALLAMTPASANAATITAVRVVGEPIVGTKVGFGVFGTTGQDHDPALRIDINAAGSPCAATAELNVDRRVEEADGTLVEGNFGEVMLAWTPSNTGQFVACAWLYDVDKTYASAQMPFAVRDARTELRLSLPHRHFDEDEAVALTVEGYAEVPRWYSVEVNRIGVPCGPTKLTNDDVRDWVSSASIVGTLGPTLTNVTTPFSGRFHVCGYVARDDVDSTPSTVVDGPTFTVGPRAVCRIRRAPKRAPGAVKIDCSGTTDPITVTARRGSRTFSTTVDLYMGTATIPGRDLGLRRHRRVNVTVRTIDGVLAGARALRVR
ncbi:MAG: hypothetical protein J7513_11435 [Solirubrobacteraceae bacterium]|nr:hypothetical protein [Solirubrobacteraceae bacterium]